MTRSLSIFSFFPSSHHCRMCVCVCIVNLLWKKKQKCKSIHFANLSLRWYSKCLSICVASSSSLWSFSSRSRQQIQFLCTKWLLFLLKWHMNRISSIFIFTRCTFCVNTHNIYVYYTYTATNPCKSPGNQTDGNNHLLLLLFECYAFFLSYNIIRLQINMYVVKYAVFPSFSSHTKWN